MKLPPAPWKTESKWKSFWLVVDDEGAPCFESCVWKLSEEGRSLLLLLSLLKLFDAVGEGSADFRIMLPPPKASANNILISSCCCCCCCCCCFGEWSLRLTLSWEAVRGWIDGSWCHIVEKTESCTENIASHRRCVRFALVLGLLTLLFLLRNYYSLANSAKILLSSYSHH